MIQLRWGNLLETEAEAVVATVNCVGVMGKGIALQVKQAFPENFRVYQAACRAKELEPGKMLTVPLGRASNPRFIINFPTKRHWRGKSRMEDVELGLLALVKEIERLGIRSIAVPPLGCGNGGLEWDDVRPKIMRALEPLRSVEVFLYAPQAAPDPRTMPVATVRPELTKVRALFVALVALYNRQGYPLGRLEMQKLAYFLQEAGQPLSLRFIKHKFGPYSPEIDHVVEKLEGHYVRGFGDRSARSQIELVPGALEAANKLLRKEAELPSILGRVADLIEGYETPYGMELLATVHFVCKENPRAALDPKLALRLVHEWSSAKKERMEPAHIEVAWNRLNSMGWFKPSLITNWAK